VPISADVRVTQRISHAGSRRVFMVYGLQRSDLSGFEIYRSPHLSEPM
jgi:hypothetical protein